eukprot:gnl/Spiro4/18515_TR9916_c0_g1_i1.p1 gnl/Spiro4/18515_TR9916_c0_g1~~gnl/Spiro4/18515_TR9916_c0_g1_i1.p1  ORF type:complete len:383 (+),score=135.00 gnl/Spiro4/18515_TR9916_c0_g1_i1:2-1150(+)
MRDSINAEYMGTSSRSMAQSAADKSEAVKRVLSAKHSRDFNLPSGFSHILKEFTREAIRRQPQSPEEIYALAAEHFRQLEFLHRPFALISASVPNPSGGWRTVLSRGLLVQLSPDNFSIQWGEQITLTTNFASGPLHVRDMLYVNGALLILDGNSGTVFEVVKEKLVPRHIIANGDGTMASPFLAQWMTMKDGDLWVGGLGHHEDVEDPAHPHPHMWVKTVGRGGVIQHIDWEKNYQQLTLNYNGEEDDTSFLIHGAARWNRNHKKWFFIPRKGYSPPPAQEYFTNPGILVTGDDFAAVDGFFLDDTDHNFEFTAFDFVPNEVDEDGNDSKIMVIKVPTKSDRTFGLESYVSILDISNQEIRPVMEDVLVPNAFDIEGLIFF